MIDFEKHNWEAFEPEVEQAIDQRQVEVQKEANRLRERQGKRSNKYYHPDFFPGHSFGLKLRLTLELGIVG